MDKKNKLDQLVSLRGYSSVDSLMEDFTTDSVVPGICINDDCDYTTDVEPDQKAGYCENCNTQTVQSCFVLMGVI